MPPEQGSPEAKSPRNFWFSGSHLFNSSRVADRVFGIILLFHVVGLILYFVEASWAYPGTLQYVLAPIHLLYALLFVCLYYIGQFIYLLFGSGVFDIIIVLVLYLIFLYLLSCIIAALWQRLSRRIFFYIFGGLFLLLIIGSDSVLYYKSETASGQLGIALPSTPYSALYACGSILFDEVPFPSDHLDASSLAADLKYILDGTQNILYVYTPSFAGMTQFETAKDGRSIKLSSGSISLGQWYQYNLQIPHLSSVAPGSGYFYMTINDLPYDGHHDSRINYPPRFIPGEASANPDFSKVKNTGPITITSYPTVNGQFYPLSIGDSVWASPAEITDPTSVSVLTQAILDRLPDLQREAYQGCPGAGCPSRAEVQRNGDRVVKEVTTLCENAGLKNNDQQIVDAVANLKNPGSNMTP